MPLSSAFAVEIVRVEVLVLEESASASRSTAKAAPFLYLGGYYESMPEKGLISLVVDQFEVRLGLNMTS